MNRCRPHPVTYDPLAWANAIRRTRGLIVLVLALVPLVWLDQAHVQLIGWVLYPIERALNAVFFPGVVTPVRGNGTALLVLAPTLALAALAFVLLRLGLALIRFAVRRVFGRMT